MLYELGDLDGPLLCRQRELVAELTAALRKSADIDADALDGLTNLLDAIADQAHDRYGVDCLLSALSPCRQRGRTQCPTDSDGDLVCPCGEGELRYVEDIGCYRELIGISGEALEIDGLYKTDGFDDGDNPRLQCSSCCAEYALPTELELKFL